MEKETSCWSCRWRLPLSASAAASPGVAGTRSPALRSRNSRRWRQCLSVSPSQRSVSTQAATRGFWLRYSDTSCAMLGLPAGRGERRGRAHGAKGGRVAAGGRAGGPVSAACTGGSPGERPSGSPETPNNSADEPPTSGGRGPAPFYNLVAAARSRALPARARPPRMPCGAATRATQRLRPPQGEGAPGRPRRGWRRLRGSLPPP